MIRHKELSFSIVFGFCFVVKRNKNWDIKEDESNKTTPKLRNTCKVTLCVISQEYRICHSRLDKLNEQERKQPF